MELPGSNGNSSCFVTKRTSYDIYFLAILVDEVMLFCLVLKRCVEISGTSFFRVALKQDGVSQLMSDAILYFVMCVTSGIHPYVSDNLVEVLWPI